MVRALGQVVVDLVVLTVLPEEYAAVLGCLRAPERVRGTAAVPNAWAWQVGTIDTTHYDAPFTVALGMARPTPTYGALIASQAIALFDPRYVAFVGVAGGFDRDGQRHGDVAVSSVVTAYEYGKLDTGGFAPRGDYTYQCNGALVRAAEAISATGLPWWDINDNPAGPPRARTGMIASGDKVIDDPDEAFFAAIRTMWPKLLAVEMEGAGVGAAVHEAQGQRAVGFILVRGISDMPHRKHPASAGTASPSTAERDGWKTIASRNAARFLAHLVATAWPVPPRHEGYERDGETVPSRSEARRVATPTRELNVESGALRQRIDDARERKLELGGLGISTGDIDQEILQLRRQLRDTGPLRPGATLEYGRYTLIRTVGRGGFAVVWEAYDRKDDRSVAIKILHQHIASDPQRKERFFRGARVMASLNHPAIVEVYDPRGDDDELGYFVMELVRGSNLREAILGQQMSPNQTLPIVVQIAEALAHAHQHDVVHRDVKPMNILLNTSGVPKLTDFDLVSAHDTTGGTRTGALGTFVYAAPECLDRPQDATARADVFGLGMTAIFCLTGRNISMDTFRNPAPTLAALDCAQPVRKVIQRAVEWEPAQRCTDAGEFLADLREAMETTRASITIGPRSTEPEVAPELGIDARVIEPPIGQRDNPTTVSTADDVILPRSSPRDQAACLLVVYGADIGKRFDLSRDFIIGRSTGTDIKIENESVSRHHCKITRDGESFTLRDLGSTNGTYVNDVRVREVALRQGDFIRVGGCVFRYLSSREGEIPIVGLVDPADAFDELTQVRSQRYLFDSLDLELAQMSVDPHELSLLLIEIDHARKLGAEGGSVAGTVLPQQITSIIQFRTRPNTIFAQWGNDAFALSLPGCGIDEAIEQARRILTAVRDIEIAVGDQTAKITVSIGVASLRDGIDDAFDLVRDADEELDLAKQAGGDRWSARPQRRRRNDATLQARSLGGSAVDDNAAGEAGRPDVQGDSSPAPTSSEP